MWCGCRRDCRSHSLIPVLLAPPYREGLRPIRAVFTTSCLRSSTMNTAYHNLQIQPIESPSHGSSPGKIRLGWRTRRSEKPYAVYSRLSDPHPLHSAANWWSQTRHGYMPPANPINRATFLSGPATRPHRNGYAGRDRLLPQHHSHRDIHHHRPPLPSPLPPIPTRTQPDDTQSWFQFLTVVCEGTGDKPTQHGRLLTITSSKVLDNIFKIFQI